MGHQDICITVSMYHISSELCLTSPWRCCPCSEPVSTSAAAALWMPSRFSPLGSRQFLRCRKCLCKSRQGPGCRALVRACAGSGRARDGWMIGEDLACSTMFGQSQARILVHWPIRGQDCSVRSFSVSLQQSGLCQAGGKNCISLYCAMWDGERINLLGYFEFQHSIYFWNSLWDQTLT